MQLLMWNWRNQVHYRENDYYLSRDCNMLQPYLNHLAPKARIGLKFYRSKLFNYLRAEVRLADCHTRIFFHRDACYYMLDLISAQCTCIGGPLKISKREFESDDDTIHLWALFSLHSRVPSRNNRTSILAIGAKKGKPQVNRLLSLIKI